ncbi:hypothetical protein H4R34_005700, partial [Dimargaris verticillata]
MASEPLVTSAPAVTTSTVPEPTDWGRLTPMVVDQLRLAVRPFTGSLDDHTWSFWHERTTNVLAGLLPGASSPVLLSAVKAVLDPAICKEVDRARITTWSSFVQHMEAHYAQDRWTNYYLAGIQAKSLFKGKTVDEAAALAQEAAWHLGGTQFWVVKILEVLLGQFAGDLKHAPNHIWQVYALSYGQLDCHVRAIVREAKAGQDRVRVLQQFAAPAPGFSKPAVKPSRVPEPVPEVAPVATDESKAKARRRSREARLKGRIEALERLLQDKDTAGKAAADQGAAYSLITGTAAKRLGLHINHRKRPQLRPYWGKAHLNILGTARARFCTAESSYKRWIEVVVADAPLAVELLVGRHQLDQLHLDLCEVPVASPDRLPKQPTLLPDRLPKQPTSSPNLATSGSKALVPVAQKIIAVPLGLPATFFTKIEPAQDPVYLREDALYPAADRASVAQRVTIQASLEAWRPKLLDTLMSGVTALREYPSGCPPPCMLKPITPPFKDDAELLFVPQAPRSLADQRFMEQYVATRLHYGIDEPGTANANVPVYSIPKPNTDARRVILDDSLGSSVNMRRVGIALPRMTQVRIFVRDALFITSMDLASYFTAIRIAPEHRDFWTFDGGACGRVRTTRLVQGNSQSPAIAHALLMHLFEELPSLRGKLLGYIDNIYLK